MIENQIQTLQKTSKKKMKQMSGVLQIAHPKYGAQGAANLSGKCIKFNKPRDALVLLQPQDLQLCYYDADDQQMQEAHGRIDLRDAQLEQTSMGFMIHDCIGNKKILLCDTDKSTEEAWRLAIYESIKATIHPQVPMSATHRISAAVTSSIRDAICGKIEFQITCELLKGDKPAIEEGEKRLQWKIWRTYNHFYNFDLKLRGIFGSNLNGILFPRERKRDSLLGGLRKKFVQEVKQQQLAMYLEKVVNFPPLHANETAFYELKTFIEFWSYFDDQKNDSVHSDGTSDEYDTEEVQVKKNEQNSPSKSLSPQKTILEHQPQQIPTSHLSSANILSIPTAYHTAPVLTPQISFQPEEVKEENVFEVPEILLENDPTEAKRLHKQILQRVRDLMNNNEERVREFQDQTKDFGKGKVTAGEYVAFLHGAIGNSDECCRLLSEMARLLPDDEKREELMTSSTALKRRSIRRKNRRRSKQFSDNAINITKSSSFKNLSSNEEKSRSKLRSKSESLSRLSMPMQDQANNSAPIAYNPESAQWNQEKKSSKAVCGFTSGKFRERKSQHSSSLNLFGEALLQQDPIQKEDKQQPIKASRFDATSSEDESESDPKQQTKSSLESESDDAKEEPGFPQEEDADYEKPVISRAEMRRKLQRSMEFDKNHQENNNQNSTGREEENPVLRRLKRQGAVNFMMRP